jgi:hypothetical protein
MIDNRLGGSESCNPDLDQPRDGSNQHWHTMMPVTGSNLEDSETITDTELELNNLQLGLRVTLTLTLTLPANPNPNPKCLSGVRRPPSRTANAIGSSR